LSTVGRDFVMAKTIEVESEIGIQVIRAEQVVIATGSDAIELPMLPFGDGVISSTGGVGMAELPAKLVVIGAGYIGLELGTAFAKMGAAVTIVEAQSRILPQYDQELTRPVVRRLRELNIEVLMGAKAKGRLPNGDGLSVESADGQLIGSSRWTKFSLRLAANRRPKVGDWMLSTLTWTAGFFASMINAARRCKASTRSET